MDRKFWIIALVAFINSMSLTILIPIIYLYGKQFHLNDFQTSLLFAIYSITQFLSTPVIGKLSDIYGRKPLLIISLAGTVIANFIAGTATTAAVLFLARFLDGITGGNNSVAQAVLSDVIPREQRAQAFGIFGAAFGLGFVVGPAISLMLQPISLGASFLASSAIAAVGLIITMVFLPETLVNKAGKMQNIFDLGLETLITGLTMPRVGILLIINFCIGTTFTIFTYAFQPYFIYILHQNSQSLTLLFVTFGILGLIMQTVGIKFLMRSLSIIRILFLSLLVRGVSFLFMPIWANVTYFVAIAVVFSIFNSLVQPTITTLISLNAKAEEQGIALGLNASYLSISNAVGPVIAGMLMNQAHPETYSHSLYVSGGLTLIVFLFAVLTRDRYNVSN